MVKGFTIALFAFALLGASDPIDADKGSQVDGDPVLAAGFERTGDVRSCITRRSIDEVETDDDTLWFIEMRNGTHFVSEVGRGCRRAGDNFTTLIYYVNGFQLCRGDFVRVMDSSLNFSMGGCSMGKFERLSRVAGSDEQID